MGYVHLTDDDRYHIYEGRVEGLTVTEIARQLGRSKSTISRELCRGAGERGYRPAQAIRKQQDRSAASANGRRISTATWAVVEASVREDWSPEQIAGRLRLAHGACVVSHEAIYLHIYADKHMGGDLHTHLRCKKVRRKRYGSGRTRRGQIRNRVGIEQRPKIVDAKSRVGDWEGDTIIGANQSHAIISMVDRRSKYTLLQKVERKTSEQVTEGIIAKLAPISALVQTMTLDNGVEFAGHEIFSKCIDADIYFARPYHSWERGLNENTNGLVRQYYPKKSCFKNITQQDLDLLAAKLNDRPRKTLDYRTPNEMIAASAKRHGVALRT